MLLKAPTRILWYTKDNIPMELWQMTESHLRNSIRMIEKSIKAGKPWREKALPYLKAELKKRREYEEKVINEYYDMLENYDEDLYDHMTGSFD